MHSGATTPIGTMDANNTMLTDSSDPDASNGSQAKPIENIARPKPVLIRNPGAKATDMVSSDSQSSEDATTACTTPDEPVEKDAEKASPDAEQSPNDAEKPSAKRLSLPEMVSAAKLEGSDSDGGESDSSFENESLHSLPEAGDDEVSAPESEVAKDTTEESQGSPGNEEAGHGSKSNAGSDDAQGSGGSYRYPTDSDDENDSAYGDPSRENIVVTIRRERKEARQRKRAQEEAAEKMKRSEKLLKALYVGFEAYKTKFTTKGLPPPALEANREKLCEAVNAIWEAHHAKNAANGLPPPTLEDFEADVAANGLSQPMPSVEQQRQSRAFSAMFEAHEAELAEKGLPLPPGWRGRIRDEWLDATWGIFAAEVAAKGLPRPTVDDFWAYMAANSLPPPPPEAFKTETATRSLSLQTQPAAPARPPPKPTTHTTRAHVDLPYGFRAPHFYRRAHVLTVSWMGRPAKPVRDLRDAFDRLYGYSLSHCRLPANNTAPRLLAAALAQLVAAYADHDKTLVVLHYAGDSRTEKSSFRICPPAWRCVPATVEIDLLSFLRDTLLKESFSPDALVLLDCPFAFRNCECPLEGKEILAATTHPAGTALLENPQPMRFTKAVTKHLAEAMNGSSLYTDELESALAVEAPKPPNPHLIPKLKPAERAERRAEISASRAPGEKGVAMLRTGLGPVRRYILLAPTVVPHPYKAKVLWWHGRLDGSCEECLKLKWWNGGIQHRCKCGWEACAARKARQKAGVEEIEMEDLSNRK